MGKAPRFGEDCYLAPNNASILYLTMVSGKMLSDDYFLDTLIASYSEKEVQTHGPSASTRHCSINFRLLQKIATIVSHRSLGYI